MKRPVVILFCVLAAGLGLGGGYALHGDEGVDRSSSGNGAPSASAGGRWSGKSLQREESRAVRVKKNAERSRGANHWLQWMSGVEDATLDDLPGLARMARDNPGALRMIAYRWLELDPHHFFRTLVKESRRGGTGRGDAFPVQELARTLFEEWPKRDAEAAIAALSSPDALVGQSGYRHRVLNVLMLENPERGLQLMREWHIHNYGPNTKGLKEWAERDPLAAMQAVIDNPAGYGTQYSMEAIVKLWAGSDVEGALEFALAAEGRLGGMMREKVLAEWAARDLDAASEWLATQDESLQRELNAILVGAWGKEDPQGALAWCEQNLAGHQLLSAVRKLAKEAAAKNPAGAGELVQAMAPSPARRQAAIAVVAEWFPSSWPSNQEIDPAAIEWIRNLGDPELQGAVLETVSWSWSNHDRDSLLAFLEEPHAAQAPDTAFHNAVRDLVRDDPHRAMEWAAGLPPERVETVTATAFGNWTMHQPGAAADWLMELPANDERRPSLLRSYVSNSAFMAEEVAAEQIARLPAADRAVARDVLRRAGIEHAKRERLLQLLVD